MRYWMNIPFPCEKNQPLFKYTTFGIGGPARYFAEAENTSQLEQMLAFAHQEHLPFFILGKGSNCLFDDRGFDGLVILNRIDYFNSEDVYFKVGAGFSFARLGQITARLGFSGLEFAAGIPATVGGAIYMNAGANGQETGNSLEEVIFINDRGEKVIYQKNHLSFAYRSSSFQHRPGAIAGATFKLSFSEEAKASQKKLVDYRLKTQPYKSKSAGCAFRNPEGSSAGRLIDECGLKGFSVGGAEISSLHANFIINTGRATAEDVLSLMSIVKEKVYKEKNILLEEEIRYIGSSYV